MVGDLSGKKLPWPCSVGVDWGRFAQHAAFRDLDEESQKAKLKTLTTTLLRRLVLGATAIAGYAEEDDTVRAVLAERVGLILMAFDPSDGVRDSDGKPYYSLALGPADRTMRVTINMGSAAEQPNDVKEKLNRLLDLRTAQNVAGAAKAARSCENMLNNKVQPTERIPVRMDLARLAESDALRRTSDRDKDTWFRRFLAIVKEHVASADGLGGMAESNSVVQEAVRAQVAAVSVTVCPDSTVRSDIGSGTYSQTWAIELDCESAVLHFRYNYTDFRAFTGIEEKVDFALDVVARKAGLASQRALQSYGKRLESKLGLRAPVAVDWGSFAYHPAYRRLDVPAQRKACDRLVNMTDSLLGHQGALAVGERGWPGGIIGVVLSWGNKRTPDQSAVQSSTKRHVRLVTVAYDPEEPKQGFAATLSDAGVLALQVSFGKRDLERWDADTTLRSCLGNRAARDAADVRTAKCEEQVRASVGSGAATTVSIAWDEFLGQPALLAMSDESQRDHITGLATHLEWVTEIVARAVAHPVAKGALRDCLDVVTIRCDPDGSPLAYSFDKGVFTITVSVPGMVCARRAKKNAPRETKLLTTLRLRFLVGCHLTYERAVGEAFLKQHADNAAALCKIPSLSITLNWSLMEEEWFRNMTPEDQAQMFATLCDVFPRRLAGRDLVAVCGHPIGARCVADNIKAVDISCTAGSGGHAAITATDRGLLATVAYGGTAEVAEGRYKEKIEFAYDLVVAIAADNAVPLHEDLQASIAAPLGRPFPLAIPLDFTKTDVFRALPPPEMADIVTILHRLPPLVGAAGSAEEQDTGLLGALCHADVVDRLVGKLHIESAEVQVDVTDQVAAPGRWSIVGSKIVFSVSLCHAMAMDSQQDWRQRALDLLDLVETVAILETRDTRERTVDCQLQRALGTVVPISLNWPAYKAEPDYRSKSARDRFRIASHLQTYVLQSLFIGNAGITGGRGLAEFSETVAAFLARVKQIAVQPSGPRCALDGDTLRIAVSTDAAQQCSLGDGKGSVSGIFASVEAELGLRVVREAAAVARARARVERGCAGVGVPCEVDWDAFVATSYVRRSDAYVALIDDASEKAVSSLAGPSGGFRDQSLVSMNLVSSKKFSAVVLVYDTTNRIKHNPGVTHSLIPHCFRASLEGATLRILTNVSNGGVGCGRVVQYLLDPSSARSMEIMERDAIARDLEQRERDHRARQIERAQRENQQAQENYNREQERYQRDMQQHEKELRESCYSCGGKRTKKCGYCQGRGTTTNNKIVSTCQSCRGRLVLDCSNCRGTGLKHPGGKSAPNPPRAPTMKSIPTFGGMPDFRAQI